MSRVSMPQRMHVRGFRNAGAFQCLLECLLQTDIGHRATVLSRKRIADMEARWKQPCRATMRFPKFAKQLECSFWQRDVTVLAALAMHEDEHSGAIHVGHL